MIFYAFFSYAHADAELDFELFKAFSTELEKRVSARLAGADMKIWSDIQKLRAGEQWDKRIEEALRASHLLIVMLSPNWLKSVYCRKEYRLFAEIEPPPNEFIIPLLVRDIKKQRRYLDAEQGAVFDALDARQYKPTLVDAFLALDANQRSLLVETIAADLEKVVEVLRESQPPVAREIAPPEKAAATAPEESPANLPSHNLPLASIGPLFMGRDAFMTSLAEALEKQSAVVAHGLGGVGKTRLAIEYAWAHAQDHSALLFVSAETPESLNAGLAALAGALKLPQQESPQDPVKIAAALDWLERNKNWLLILDNVDDARAADAVKPLLPKLANGRVIVTARYDKFDAAIRSLPLGVLSPDASRDFLLARTEGRRRAQDDDSARAAEVAKDLGFLALALEQAGAYVATRRISFARYLTFWREERARVADWFDKSAMATNHDYGLAAAWRTSVDQLTPQGRRLLERVAFLAPEPIPEFLLDVAVPSSFETAPSGPPQDEGTGGEPKGPHAEERPQAASRSARAVPEPFDAREALADLYAYSLAAPAEIEGRYRQPAFVVHRLVQDFVRNSMDETHKGAMLREALAWVNEAFVGDPNDVRDWPRLDPLAAHAKSVAEAADAANIAAPTARLMNGIGELLRCQARYAEAKPYHQRALEIERATRKPSDPILAKSINCLAILLKDMGELQAAELLYREALNISEDALGPDHPDVAIRLNNLAGLMQATNRLDEAEPFFRRALDISEKSLGPDHPKVAIRLNNLAQLLQATNRLTEAEPLMRRALTIREASFGPDHPDVANSFNNLASLLRATNRPGEAEPLLHRALKICAASLGSDHPHTQIVARNYRRLLVELGTSEREAEEKIAAILAGK